MYLVPRQLLPELPHPECCTNFLFLLFHRFVAIFRLSGLVLRHLQAYLNRFTFRFNRCFYSFNIFRSFAWNRRRHHRAANLRYQKSEVLLVDGTISPNSLSAFSAICSLLLANSLIACVVAKLRSASLCTSDAVAKPLP